MHHGSGAGGAANSLLYLLNSLDRDRYEPLIACNFEAPKAREYFSKQGFQPRHVPLAPFAHTSKSWDWRTPRGLAKLLQWYFLKLPAARGRVRELVEQVKPELVHLNGVSLLPLAATIEQCGVPVVQHIRESVNEGQFGLRKKWLARLAKRHASHVVYICQDGRTRFPVSSANYSVIYDPVPLDKFRTADSSSYRLKLGISGDGPVLFFPGGSMLDIKGIIPFLLALAKVHTRHSDVVAIIPGIDQPPHPRDDCRKKIENIVRESSLEQALRRVPFSDNVEQYYVASDIVVAPFIRPHFSRAVIEAGAIAKPVVGSRIGGIEEVLEDSATGLLCNVNDPDDLAEKLCELMEDRQRAEAMGRAGYVKSSENYGAAEHARAIMEVYDSILADRDDMK